ncbi:MAG: hypothetical protein WBG92_25030, partial [Thiohalocapsa sp.]
MARAESGQPHQWRFARLGGFDQVVIESGADICNLPRLDQKLWAALSCPTTGLEFDARTLALLDSDDDGHIRVPDVLAAVTWLCRVLKEPGELLQRNDALPLAAIDDGNDEGRTLLASAKLLLRYLGEPDASVITAEQTVKAAEVFADAARFNGDGVVPPAVAGDELVARAIEDIMACVGSVADRSGADGIDRTLAERFFAEAAAFLDWWREADADAARLLPLGSATEQAAAVFEAVQGK